MKKFFSYLILPLIACAVAVGVLGLRELFEWREVHPDIGAPLGDRTYSEAMALGDHIAGLRSKAEEDAEAALVVLDSINETLDSMDEALDSIAEEDRVWTLGSRATVAVYLPERDRIRMAPMSDVDDTVTFHSLGSQWTHLWDEMEARGVQNMMFDYKDFTEGAERYCLFYAKMVDGTDFCWNGETE